jgi:hypothetical protein
MFMHHKLCCVQSINYSEAMILKKGKKLKIVCTKMWHLFILVCQGFCTMTVIRIENNNVGTSVVLMRF